MAYLNTKDVYDLFGEHGVAHLHVTDIDSLPRIKQVPNLDIYKCHVEFDNGAVKEDKIVIAFASDIDYVPYIVSNMLCKTSEDYARTTKIEKINVGNGDAFVITDEYKNGQ